MLPSRQQEGKDVGGGARPQSFTSVDGDGVEGGGVNLKYLLIQYIAGKGH